MTYKKVKRTRLVFTSNNYLLSIVFTRYYLIILIIDHQFQLFLLKILLRTY